MTMNYQEVLTYLDALQMHKIKLGLGAMQDFLEKVGRPETSLRCIHVAGTNGKGTVCTALAEILSASGYKVGVFTSPHLSSVRERFRVADRYISREEFARIGSRVCEVLGEDKITYFEFTTALAFLWFAEIGVDLVMLETGMGGRLDATNVVRPLLSVITSISMDHEIYLGDSLPKIAAEKAGIIKAGVPVICGATAEEAKRVVAATADECQSPLYQLGRDFDYVVESDGSWSWRGKESFTSTVIDSLRSSSPSLIQQENESLAVAAILLLREHGINVSKEQVREGLSRMRWAGRMELLSVDIHGKKRVQVLIDGAHNPDGVKNLTATLQRSFNYQRLLAVWGAMADKDLSATLGTIIPLVDTLIIAKAPGERSATPEFIRDRLPPTEMHKAICVSAPAAALDKALELATADDLVLIGGSLYLIGELRQKLVGELAP